MLAFGSFAAAAAWSAGVVARGAETPTPAAAATLRLADGGYVAGELKGSPRPDVVCWQGTEFTAPFEFAVGQVSAVQFPPSAKRPKPAGEFCFELSEGDLLFGSLVAWSAEEALLDLPHFGPVHVRRADRLPHAALGATVPNLPTGGRTACPSGTKSRPAGRGGKRAAIW